jgi:hypothetical protein
MKFEDDAERFTFLVFAPIIIGIAIWKLFF